MHDTNEKTLIVYVLKKMGLGKGNGYSNAIHRKVLQGLRGLVEGATTVSILLTILAKSFRYLVQREVRPGQVASESTWMEWKRHSLQDSC